MQRETAIFISFSFSRKPLCILITTTILDGKCIHPSINHYAHLNERRCTVMVKALKCHEKRNYDRVIIVSPVKICVSRTILSIYCAVQFTPKINSRLLFGIRTEELKSYQISIVDAPSTHWQSCECEMTQL